MPPDDLTPEEAAELDGTPFSTIAALRAAQAAIRLQVWREFFSGKCVYDIRSLGIALTLPRGGTRPLLRINAEAGNVVVTVRGLESTDAQGIIVSAIDAYRTLIRAGEIAPDLPWLR